MSTNIPPYYLTSSINVSNFITQKRLLLARYIAESLCTSILGTPLPPLAPELKVKAIGYDGYDYHNT